MLTNKKVLFICTPFHEYPKRIKEAIESLNGSVDMFFVERRSIISTFLLNTNLKLYNKFRIYQQNRILKKIKNINYDYILIQYPFFLTHEFFQKLKKTNLKSKFINYNWDSIEARDYTPYIQYFDKVFSFDSYDCSLNSNIHYLPLFFTNDFNTLSIKAKKYDLVFIGGIGDSENRYEFVCKIEKECNLKGIVFYKYLYCSFNFYIKSLLKGKIYHGVRFKKLTLSEIAALYKKSLCVIDYQNFKQKGLTMRTFEVLGSGCKLITTNDRILSAEFFNSKIISTINRNKPEIDKEFIFRSISNDHYSVQTYSINSWIINIFKN